MSRSYYEDVYYRLLGEYFRARREEKDLTLDELSNIFEVNRNTYYCYERGTRACPIDLFIALCKYYDDNYLGVFKHFNDETNRIVKNQKEENEKT